MKKVFKILLLASVLFLSATLGACLDLFKQQNVQTYQISFVQEGQKTIVKSYKMGDGLDKNVQPVQPTDTTLVTEWNVVDDYVVGGDAEITAVTYSKGLEFSQYFDSFKRYEVVNYSGTAEKVIIPAYYKGLPVSKIAGRRSDTFGVFEKNTSVKEVVLPEGLTCIKQYAFNGCTNLSKINLPSTLEVIENHAFVDCNFNVEKFVVPNATLGERSFFGVKTNTLIIEEGVTIIPNYCFAGKSGRLKNVVLPYSLTNISGLAFWMQPIENIYYCGDEGDFYNLTIGEESYREENFESYLYEGAMRYKFGEKEEVFIKPTLYYYSENTPEYDGNFWRYVNGVPTKW